LVFLRTTGSLSIGLTNTGMISYWRALPFKHKIESVHFDTDFVIMKRKIFGIYCGLEPAIFINDADMLKEINVRQFSKFSSRKSPFVNTVVGPLSKDWDQRKSSALTRVPVDPWLKDFMTNLDGHKWKRVRQTTMPTFSATKLESMCPSFNDSAQITIRKVFKLTNQLEAHILIGRKRYPIDVYLKTF